MVCRSRRSPCRGRGLWLIAVAEHSGGSIVAVDGTQHLCSILCATLGTVEIIGIRELRQNASLWVAKAKAGRTIQITDRGRPVARLVPLTSIDQARDKLIAEDQLIPASAPRVPLSTADLIGGPSLTSILDEQRADR